MGSFHSSDPAAHPLLNLAGDGRQFRSERNYRGSLRWHASPIGIHRLHGHVTLADTHEQTLAPGGHTMCCSHRLLVQRFECTSERQHVMSVASLAAWQSGDPVLYARARSNPQR